MELGFHIPIFDIDGGTTAIASELARVGVAAEESGATWLYFMDHKVAAEESGATWLSFMDHYFQIEPTGLPAESNMLRATPRSASWPRTPRRSGSASSSPA